MRRLPLNAFLFIFLGWKFRITPSSYIGIKGRDSSIISMSVCVVRMEIGIGKYIKGLKGRKVTKKQLFQWTLWTTCIRRIRASCVN